MFFNEAIRRVKMLFRGKQYQDDLDEEMRLHRELREKKYVDSGMSPEVARSAAYRSFGNAASLRETSYRTWGWSWLDSLTQDVRYGVRSMFRSPALTLVALLSLALGIGANTAIFSFLDAIMLRSLPVKEPTRLVLLGEGNEGASPTGTVRPRCTPIRSIASSSRRTRSSPTSPQSIA
jgi:hypothetical protein